MIDVHSARQKEMRELIWATCYQISLRYTNIDGRGPGEKIVGIESM